MKFTVSVMDFTKALGVVNKAIDAKSPRPILECVYIKAVSAGSAVIKVSIEGIADCSREITVHPPVSAVELWTACGCGKENSRVTVALFYRKGGFANGQN